VAERKLSLKAMVGVEATAANWFEEGVGKKVKSNTERQPMRWFLFYSCFT